MKAKKSFVSEVLNYMRKGRTLTVEQAHQKWGSGKLSTRLSEKSNEGYVFEKKTKTVKTRFGRETEIAVYKMISEPKNK